MIQLISLARTALLLVSALGLAATAIRVTPPQCHMELKSLPGEAPALRCVPIVEDCTACGLSGQCEFSETVYENGRIRFFLCLCTNSTASSPSDCFTSYTYDVDTGLEELACHNQCCGTSCLDKTGWVWFTDWTNACECKQL